MAKFSVQIACTLEAYNTVEIEAPDEKAARDQALRDAFTGAEPDWGTAGDYRVTDIQPVAEVTDASWIAEAFERAEEFADNWEEDSEQQKPGDEGASEREIIEALKANLKRLKPVAMAAPALLIAVGELLERCHESRLESDPRVKSAIKLHAQAVRS